MCWDCMQIRQWTLSLSFTHTQANKQTNKPATHTVREDKKRREEERDSKNGRNKEIERLAVW